MTAGVCGLAWCSHDKPGHPEHNWTDGVIATDNHGPARRGTRGCPFRRALRSRRSRASRCQYRIRSLAERRGRRVSPGCNHHRDWPRQGCRRTDRGGCTMTSVARNRALCCKCGNVRTVAALYRRGSDQNHSNDDGQHPGGWRMTRTLRCAICKASTCHAILRDDVAAEHRDGAELREPLPDASADPDRWRIRDHQGSSGGHPRSSRSFSVVHASGSVIATAAQYPDHWQIDIEGYAIRAAGFGVLSHELFTGFRVRREEEAYDWLRCSVRLLPESLRGNWSDDGYLG